MTTDSRLWKRKVSLWLTRDNSALDLSEMHFKFNTQQADVESPSNCNIRVYNLSDATLQAVEEYGEVILQAGYASQYGIIFKGNIKQFRKGRENATDTFVDILAADGDMGYNFSVVNTTLEAGASPRQQVDAALAAMSPMLAPGYIAPMTGGVLPRGKVLFGMARDQVRRGAVSSKATWSISNGKVNIIPLDGYKPGTVVVLNAANGMVGVPEQTNNGVSVTTLLNPLIEVGGLVQIDNKSINQIIQQDKNAAPIPYNQWAGIQLLAKVTSDGLYRVFVAEHEGDTRGLAWHSKLICLALDPSSNKIKPYG